MPEDVLPPVLIKPGKRKCDKYFQCTGYSNINPITRIIKAFFFNLKTVLLLSQEDQDDGPIGLSAKAIAVSTGTLESRKGVAR